METGNLIEEGQRPGGMALTKRALHLCDLPPGSRVLDIGCGTGATVQYLAARQYVSLGIDICHDGLERSRAANPSLPLLQGTGESLPIPSGSMAAIFAECTFSLFDNPDRVLLECARVLKPNGVVIASDIYARDIAGAADLERLPAGTCLRGAVSQVQVVARLHALGFRVLLWEDHSELLKGWTAPVSMLGLDDLELQLAVNRVQLGYYLVIARREVLRWGCRGGAHCG